MSDAGFSWFADETLSVSGSIKTVDNSALLVKVVSDERPAISIHDAGLGMFAAAAWTMLALVVGWKLRAAGKSRAGGEE